MKNLNRFQTKLLANFCSDVAKGTVLGGAGITYGLPASLLEKTVYLLLSILTAGAILLLALQIGDNLSNE